MENSSITCYAGILNGGLAYVDTKKSSFVHVAKPSGISENVEADLLAKIAARSASPIQIKN